MVERPRSPNEDENSPAQPSMQDLMETINSLRAQVDALQNQGATPVNPVDPAPRRNVENMPEVPETPEGIWEVVMGQVWEMVDKGTKQIGTQLDKQVHFTTPTGEERQAFVTLRNPRHRRLLGIDASFHQGGREKQTNFVDRFENFLFSYGRLIDLFAVEEQKGKSISGYREALSFPSIDQAWDHLFNPMTKHAFDGSVDGGDVGSRKMTAAYRFYSKMAEGRTYRLPNGSIKVIDSMNQVRPDWKQLNIFTGRPITPEDYAIRSQLRTAIGDPNEIEGGITGKICEDVAYKFIRVFHKREQGDFNMNRGGNYHGTGMSQAEWMQNWRGRLLKSKNDKKKGIGQIDQQEDITRLPGGPEQTIGEGVFPVSINVSFPDTVPLMVRHNGEMVKMTLEEFIESGHDFNEVPIDQMSLQAHQDYKDRQQKTAELYELVTSLSTQGASDPGFWEPVNDLVSKVITEEVVMKEEWRHRAEQAYIDEGEKPEKWTSDVVNGKVRWNSDVGKLNNLKELVEIWQAVVRYNIALGKVAQGRSRGAQTELTAPKESVIIADAAADAGTVFYFNRFNPSHWADWRRRTFYRNRLVTLGIPNAINRYTDPEVVKQIEKVKREG